MNRLLFLVLTCGFLCGTGCHHEELNVNRLMYENRLNKNGGMAPPSDLVECDAEIVTISPSKPDHAHTIIGSVLVSLRLSGKTQGDERQIELVLPGGGIEEVIIRQRKTVTLRLTAKGALFDIKEIPVKLQATDIISDSKESM